MIKGRSLSSLPQGNARYRGAGQGDAGHVGRVIGVDAEAELQVVADLVLVGEIGPAEDELVVEVSRGGRGRLEGDRTGTGQEVPVIQIDGGREKVWGGGVVVWAIRLIRLTIGSMSAPRARSRALLRTLRITVVSFFSVFQPHDKETELRND